MPLRALVALWNKGNSVLKRHLLYFISRTTSFLNPATARIADSRERTGAAKAPVCSPAILSIDRFALNSGGIKRIFTGFGADDPKSPPPFGRESIVPGYSQGQFHAEARTHFARPEGQKSRTKTALLCLAMRAAVRGEWG